MASVLPELSDYNYPLPPELIALYPQAKREGSRLLVFSWEESTGQQLELQDSYFRSIGKYLYPDDILIINNTRVSPRRLYLKNERRKELFETLFLNMSENGAWNCLLRGRRKLRIGEILHCPAERDTNQTIQFVFNGAYLGDTNSEISQLYPLKRLPESMPPHVSPQIAWKTPEDAQAYFERYGSIPIPPYLSRDSEEIDRERYQTVYAQNPRSVAAPTAGLHFSNELLNELQEERGVTIATLELSVGYGTFAPLRRENLLSDSLHAEEYYIPPESAQLLNEKQRRKIAVGTTTLRALEANFRMHGGKYVAGNFQTQLFIRPPDRIQTIDGLITNFHLPASSLLLLVSSFIGKEKLLNLYEHAIQKRYRFFSYGDAMYILKSKS